MSATCTTSASSTKVLTLAASLRLCALLQAAVKVSYNPNWRAAYGMISKSVMFNPRYKPLGPCCCTTPRAACIMEWYTCNKKCFVVSRNLNLSCLLSSSVLDHLRDMNGRIRCFVSRGVASTYTSVLIDRVSGVPWAHPVQLK